MRWAWLVAAQQKRHDIFCFHDPEEDEGTRTACDKAVPWWGGVTDEEWKKDCSIWTYEQPSRSLILDVDLWCLFSSEALGCADLLTENAAEYLRSMSQGRRDICDVDVLLPDCEAVCLKGTDPRTPDGPEDYRPTLQCQFVVDPFGTWAPGKVIADCGVEQVCLPMCERSDGSAAPNAEPCERLELTCFIEEPTLAPTPPPSPAPPTPALAEWKSGNKQEEIEERNFNTIGASIVGFSALLMFASWWSKRKKAGAGAARA